MVVLRGVEFLMSEVTLYAEERFRSGSVALYGYLAHGVDVLAGAKESSPAREQPGNGQKGPESERARERKKEREHAKERQTPAVLAGYPLHSEP